MASPGVSVDRLRAFLRDLKPEAQAMLAAELERGALRGQGVPGADLILRELLPVLRGAESEGTRIDTPARVFFKPLEPFLVDPGPAGGLPGRVERTSLVPLWEWISRDLVPEEAKSYSEQMLRALTEADEAGGAALARKFQDLVVEAISAKLQSVQFDERARRRFIAQIATAHALDDLQALHGVLRHRDALRQIEARLPAAITNFGDEQLENVVGLLQHTTAGQPQLLLCALVLVMSRLGAAWQLIRVAIRSAESDIAARVAQSPLAVAGVLVLADIERRIDELRDALKRGAVPEAIGYVKILHDTIRGMRTEMDLSGDSAWARELAALRKEISDLLKPDIEGLPSRVRRLLRPRPAKEIPPGAGLDALEVAETQALIELVGACRNCAGELAVNESAPRAQQELRSYFDTNTPTLLDALRNAGPDDRKFRQSQVDAAIRFASKLFGSDYAAVLSKAATVAAVERKPMRA